MPSRLVSIDSVYHNTHTNYVYSCLANHVAGCGLQGKDACMCYTLSPDTYPFIFRQARAVARVLRKR